MTFVDDLRAARSSRAAVLHEFWMQYDPTHGRVHVFFEGRDDEVFYRRFLAEWIPRGKRLYAYRCLGKSLVYDAFSQITSRYPDIRSVLFFVDKDLDDILGSPWPTDPRVFVTDVYSIENYLVSRDVLERIYRDSIQVVGLEFTTAAFLDKFDLELARFHRAVLSVTAWILTARRAGLRVNLGDCDLGKMLLVSDSCEIGVRRCHRVQYLTRVTGVPSISGSFRRVSHAYRELRRMPPKRIVRGKFEAWFLVEFWKKLIKQLQLLSKEKKGSLKIKLALEESNLVPVLAAHVKIPRSLELFLSLHFPRATLGGEQSGAANEYGHHWLSRTIAWTRRKLGV